LIKLKILKFEYFAELYKVKITYCAYSTLSKMSFWGSLRPNPDSFCRDEEWHSNNKSL